MSEHDLGTGMWPSFTESLRAVANAMWELCLVMWRKEVLRSYRIDLLECIDTAQRKVDRIEGELERRGLRYD